MQLVYIQICPLFLNFPLQNRSEEEESFKSMPHLVISENATKMKRRNCKGRQDNLERQNALFHKVKILLQNDPELADTFLTYIGNYTQAYIVTEKFLLDMHNIKYLNEICPSSLKETN